MELKTLKQKVKGLTDGGEDRGVSPVIGVILMVAITVILAAVIGAFVLGLGDDLGNSSGPQAQFSLSESEDPEKFELNHMGGDEIDINEITVLVNGSAIEATFQDSEGTTLTTLTAGETAVVGTDGEAGDLEIRLRHDPSSSIVYSGEIEVTSST